VTGKPDSAYVSRNGKELHATMTSMNVSMPQYVVTEQTVAATTHRGRMNVAASDLTTLMALAVSKVTYDFASGITFIKESVNQ